MGKAIFRAFDVGTGDCLFLTLEEGEMTFSIMIDCGKLNGDVRDYIKNTLNKKIDILIITHIDGDHINGIKTLLSEIQDLEIGSVLYNCAQYCCVEESRNLTDVIQNNMDELRGTNVQIADNGEIAAHKALTIAELLLTNENWKQAWQKQNGYISTESDDIALPNNFGKLIILSPEPKDIGRLDVEFIKAFNEKLYDKYDGPYSNEATIYEILVGKIKEDVNHYSLPISAEGASIGGIKRLASMKSPHNVSPTNSTSIALIWECGDSRVLFCGDADPEVIVYNYLKKSNHFDNKAIFNVIKVPHHGSEHNCGSKFWDTFDSDRIFFTGSDKNGRRPSKICIAKVIARDSDMTRHLHFTKVSPSMKWYDEVPPLIKETFNYDISNDCIYEFEY